MSATVYRHVATITASDLKHRIAQGDLPVIVDVREQEEIDEGKIPQARHIALWELTSRIDELDPAAETVLVCRSGRRSLAACKVMILAGFENVKNMENGMLAWTGALA
ncbi:rhodanese-like domain-containing protein [Tumebacillus sp. DT12]|uniref:Rhodanese-like domain-containing protein n=1 Tax=Tumebacillus lacus TaxID=2995335 RepID=A0ABT3WYP0_9BACL|nr:rhodanese-like domain-containing protein [Tumebacillus lacus]MCX7569775.1 rhodanese-like domain-containing protein [Tumebacillus lacus]